VIPLVLWFSLLLPPCTITGTPGDDAIMGTAHRDVICAYGGSDTIAAGAGNDVIIAGPGSDRVDPGAGHDSVYLGPGNDLVISWQDRGGDFIDGGPGIDTGVPDGYDRLVSVERRR
jgi:Ca2+-binding RTX toxin-like protein